MIWKSAVPTVSYYLRIESNIYTKFTELGLRRGPARPVFKFLRGSDSF
jgi:hypothetical protein